VLVGAIRDGLGLLTWAQDSFAYADDFDEAAGRYRGLQCGQLVHLSPDNLTGLLFQPEIAVEQQKAETTTEPRAGPTPPAPNPPGLGSVPPEPVSAPKRFHGTVTLDPTRVGRDAGRVADDVIAHLAGLVG
jgi:hypothetical protein